MKTNLTIRNCDRVFRFQCPQLWTDLSATETADIRHCAVCDREVFFCTTDEETIEHAKAGHCIARELPDDDELPQTYLGEPNNVPDSTPDQEKAAAWSGRERGIDDSIQNADAERPLPEVQLSSTEMAVDLPCLRF